MNETSLTVCGNVATTPRSVQTNEGLSITSFRIASTARKFDRGTQRWVDAETTFLTVTCFRGLADNVAASLDKGQRVIVTGKLRVKPWARDGKSGTNVEIDAWSVGHDLAFGTSTFNRIVRIERVEQPGRVEADELALKAMHEQEQDAAVARWSLSGGDPQEDGDEADFDRDGELVDALAVGAG
jgi:single-strand DNA-binding protein